MSNYGYTKTKLKKYWKKINHGLFLYGITNRLQRMGIVISPYYWEKEFTELCEIPKIKGETSSFCVKNFGPEEIKIICLKGYGYNEKKMLYDLNNGKLCIGLFHENNIAAYSWIELNELIFRKKKITLKNNQAYLGGMYTVEEYRGKNIAAYLRYHTSLYLLEIGKNEIYSISDFLNYPAIKFKKKLNAKHIKLHLYIKLFKLFEWNFLIKKYQ